MNIIIAEDDSDCLNLIAEAVKGMASKIRTTDEVKCLMSMLGPDVLAVWMDLSLKDCTADEMCDTYLPEIRNTVPQATLMVVSGFGDEYRARALAAGANAYAEKSELCGFKDSCVTALLSTAALDAINRGVDAQLILKRVSEWTHRLAHATA